MSDIIEMTKSLEGCEYLIKQSTANDSFCPEDLNEEQLMIKETIDEFVNQEVKPLADRLEKLEEGLNSMLLEKMGQLGLLSSHMPEYLGGLDLDFNSNTIIAEGIGPAGGFSVTYNAHTGIGMLPILYFGTEEQKKAYLPKLMTGEWAAAYCLTEPSSGSDALAAKTTATLSEDGKHWILNGQKMWISNAGFAKVFTVFAQVDGSTTKDGKSGFTGFIVERDTEGFTMGAEEQKLGIKASSTRQVFLENVKIPVNHLLGEIGKGHLIAFNVLNIGRFKLGASCLGGTKGVVDVATQYANERYQFKVPISSFGAIKYKIAESALQTYISESDIYRVSGLINAAINKYKAEGRSYNECKLQSAEDYALECSIIKIVGSEVLDYVVDEAVQIHGGMGYSEENKIVQAYRDSRINRIFEGTNEINRLLMVKTLLKKAMSGQLDIVTPALAVQSELENGERLLDDSTALFQEEKNALQGFKNIFLMIIGSAAKLAMSQKLDLKEEQEIVMNISDIMIDIFNCESVLLRIEKHQSKTEQNPKLYESILRLCFHDATSNIIKNATDAIGSFIKEDKIKDYIRGVRFYAKYPIQNVRDLRRNIADHLIQNNKYDI